MRYPYGFLVRGDRLFCVVIFATLSAFAATSTQAAIFTSTDIGVQLDHLRWHISTPTFRPNILSELTFKSLSPMGRLNFAWFHKDRPWLIIAQYGFGQVVDGTVKDEDFALDNRQSSSRKLNMTPTAIMCNRGNSESDTAGLMATDYGSPPISASNGNSHA